MARAITCVLAVVVLSLSVFAQASTISGGGELSPRVVATWEAQGKLSGGLPLSSGPFTLNLMVLWRGKPGWLTAGAAKSGSNELFAGPGSDRTHSVTVSGRKVSLRVDPKTNTAHVRNHAIPLEGVNVILLDDVDGAVAVAGTTWVDPEFPLDREPTEALVRRSSQLTDFVQFTR